MDLGQILGQKTEQQQNPQNLWILAENLQILGRF